MTHDSSSPAEACELALQQLFAASVQICRAMRDPQEAEPLLRSTVIDLDLAIRALRPTVSALFDA